MSEKATDLIPSVASMVPAEVFSSEIAINTILGEIERRALDFAPDTSTVTSRKAIASMAYKVAQSKTFLDNMGQGLVAEWKRKAAEVDKGRKKIRDTLDELRDRVRMPLTIWEGEETARLIKEQAEKEYSEAWDAAHQEYTLFLEQQARARAEAEAEKAKAKAIEEAARAQAEADAAKAKMQAEMDAEKARMQAEIEKAQAKARAAEEEAARVKKEMEDKTRLDAIRVKAEIEAKAAMEALEAEIDSRVKEETQADYYEPGCDDEEEGTDEPPPWAPDPNVSKEPITDAAPAVDKVTPVATPPGIPGKVTTHEKEARRIVNRAIVEALAKVKGMTPETAREVVKAIFYGAIPHLDINYNSEN